jgi:uncharacterized protein (DUF1778 family)
MSATEERGRITARMSGPLVEKLQQAADLCGSTLNQFLVQAALKEADRIIEQERVIRFTKEDAELFMDMLDAPRAPNEALMKAYERYKDKMKNGTLRNRTEDGA